MLATQPRPCYTLVKSMASSSAAASENLPVQERSNETVSSPEATDVDRASGEYETAAAFVQEQATQTIHELQRFSEIANDNEFPEAGAEAATAAEAAKTEISAVAQKTESQIAAEIRPLPPTVQMETVKTPETEAKLTELESVADQARVRMSEIFAKLMEMKASGNKLDAGEYEAYKKMLDEDPMLNGFVQKLQSQFNNEGNDGSVRARAAQLASEFAEGAQNQQSFAEQMARAGAEKVASAPGAEVAVSAEAAGSEKANEAPVDANEGPALQGLRGQATVLAAEMKYAMSIGNFELFDKSLEKLLEAKRQLLVGLMGLSNISDRQKLQINRLVPEIASLEKEKEIRVEMAELKELEKEKKKIEAEVEMSTREGKVEETAHAKERLAEVQKKIDGKNRQITAVRGQLADLDKLSGTGDIQSIHPGDAVAGVADTIGKSILDPGEAGLKILDKVIGK